MPATRDWYRSYSYAPIGAPKVKKAPTRAMAGTMQEYARPHSKSGGAAASGRSGHHSYDTAGARQAPPPPPSDPSADDYRPREPGTYALDDEWLVLPVRRPEYAILDPMLTVEARAETLSKFEEEMRVTSSVGDPLNDVQSGGVYPFELRWGDGPYPYSIAQLTRDLAAGNPPMGHADVSYRVLANLAARSAYDATLSSHHAGGCNPAWFPTASDGAPRSGDVSNALNAGLMLSNDVREGWQIVLPAMPRGKVPTPLVHTPFDKRTPSAPEIAGAHSQRWESPTSASNPYKGHWVRHASDEVRISVARAFALLWIDQWKHARAAMGPCAADEWASDYFERLGLLHPTSKYAIVSRLRTRTGMRPLRTGAPGEEPVVDAVPPNDTAPSYDERWHSFYEPAMLTSDLAKRVGMPEAFAPPVPKNGPAEMELLLRVLCDHEKSTWPAATAHVPGELLAHVDPHMLVLHEVPHDADSDVLNHRHPLGKRWKESELGGSGALHSRFVDAIGARHLQPLVERGATHGLMGADGAFAELVDRIAACMPPWGNRQLAPSKWIPPTSNAAGHAQYGTASVVWFDKLDMSQGFALLQSAMVKYSVLGAVLNDRGMRGAPASYSTGWPFRVLVTRPPIVPGSAYALSMWREWYERDSANQTHRRWVTGGGYDAYVARGLEQVATDAILARARVMMRMAQDPEAPSGTYQEVQPDDDDEMDLGEIAQ